MPTLRETIKGIADTIREKDGSQETMSLLEMPSKVSALTTSKYGVDMDCLFGDVNPSGYLENPSKRFEFNCPDVVTAKTGALNAFAVGTQVTKVALDNLQVVESNAMARAFYNCPYLSEVHIPRLSSNNGLREAFSQTYDKTTLKLVDIHLAEAVPAFNNMLDTSSSCSYRVVVPSSLYSEWIAASGWSRISSRIQAYNGGNV